MNKSMKWLFISLFFILSGCATGPIVSVNSRNLKADYVVYFEQSDRIPRDVLLIAHTVKTNGVNQTGTIETEQWDKILDVTKKLFEVAPEMAKQYTNERMNNAMLNRRMLFVGYKTPEELDKIIAIVEKMGNVIEYSTPQEK